MKTFKNYLTEISRRDFISRVTARKDGEMTLRITRIGSDDWYIANVSVGDHEFRVNSILYPDNREVEDGELRDALFSRIARDVPREN